MADPKPPKQPAWKRSAGAPAPSKQPANKGWQDNKAPNPKAPVTAWGLSRRAQIGIVVTALLGVVGGGVWWATRPTPDTKPHFVLLEAGYETNLAVPPNVAGRNGVKSLAEAVNDPGRVKTGTLLAGGKGLAELFEPGSKIPQELVVFVAAHGVARSDGGKPFPCLVPHDYDAAKPEGVVKLSDLLEQLNRKHLADTKKLLILDVAGVRGDWSLGQFHSTFLSALEDAKGELAAVPNLVVMVSADKDEFSWVAPEWGTTIFAHYVAEGLRGGAGTESVNAESLHEYVKKKVADWARHNRARSQKPRLIEYNDRARGIHLAGRQDAYVEPAPPEQAPVGLDECAKMWDECLALEQERSPWLTDPVRWRKYQDCLLRAEELLRAGDADHAREVRKTASDLKEVIAGARGTPPPSLGLTLAMPDVLAASLGAKATEWLTAFTRHLQADKYDESLRDVDNLGKAAANTRERQLLRTRAAAVFLREVAANPKKFWEAADARKLLARLDDPTDPNSAEAHYLVMLRPDEKRGGPLAPLLRRKDEAKAWELVGKALRVRLLAEQAAAGLSPEAADRSPLALSGEVLPWVREMIDKADVKRRKGQDLLFTSEEAKAWPEAEAQLDAAQAEYARAAGEAGKVRRAILARDEAMAALPYYTRWLARRPLNEAEEEHLVRQPWERLRKLDAKLNEAAKQGERKTDGLPQLTDDLRKGLDTVRAEYLRLVEQQEQAPTQQDKWHEIDGLLRVPVSARGLNSGQRVQLLKRIHEIGAALSAAKAPEDARGVEKAGELAQAEAKRQARFALETLRDRPEAPRDWSEKAESGLFNVGQWVSAQLLLLAKEAQKELSAANDPTKDLPAVIQALGEAAARAKRVEGWAFDRPLSDEPTRRYRNLLLHRFLCWQADRTYLDHWAAADPTSQEPYYLRAGQRFLSHARALLQADDPERDTKKKPDPRGKEMAAVDARLKSPSPFAVEVSATGQEEDYQKAEKRNPLRISDEAFIPRWHRLAGPKEVNGDPVAWVDCEQGVQAKGEDTRRVRKIGDVFRGEIRPRGEIGTRRGQPGKYTVRAYFRGQESAVEVNVQVYAEPDLVVVQPPQAQTARLAVLAQPDLLKKVSVQKAAIAIVLDASGSMTENRLPGTDTLRWDAATDALRGVMRQLPEGVTVSLRAFLKEGGVGDTRDLRDPKHEEFVRFKRVWRAHRWDPANLDARMREVTALKPSGATPLVRAMWRAREDFPPGFTGRRILIVVTDGGDSNFYETKTYNVDGPLKKAPRETITQSLQRAFKADKRFSDIEVHVIAIDVTPGKSDTEAERKAAEEMPGAVEKIEGKYYNAKDARTLAQYLSSTLHAKTTFLVDAAPNNPGHDRLRTEGEISPADGKPGSLRWLSLPARDYERYTVRPRSLSKDDEFPVRLLPGDSLAVQLVQDGARARFRRMLYAESAAIRFFHGGCKEVKSVKSDDEEWLFAALQNERGRAADAPLQLLTTIEQKQGPAVKDRHVQTARPRWTWFEVYDGKQPARELRVFPVGSYPAPAWGLEAPGWPENSSSVRLQAWWLGDKLPRLGLPHVVDRGKSILDLKEEPWDRRPEDERVVIESVRLEPCKLRQPGGDGRLGAPEEVRDCLVVRLRYPKDKGPFFVQLDPRGEWEGGQAHRWFHEAGKYTGVFWSTAQPLTPAAAKGLRSLYLYSITELKAASASETLDLGRPNEAKVRPAVP